MPYVRRDTNNKVIGLFARPQSAYPVEYLPDTHADVLAFHQIRIDEEVRIETLNAKKAIDVTALGTRVEMQTEAANANSVPALRTLVLKLAEIIYSNEKNTID